MKKNYLKIIFVIDESGSMHGTETDVIGGFNSFIEKQRTQDYGKIDVTLYKFSNESSRIFNDLPLNEIRPLSTKDYIPGGATALYDTIGVAINEADRRINHLKLEHKPNMVMMVIITDGQENASREYSAHTVQQLIQGHEKNENWQFIYLGADLSSFADADDLGIKYRASSRKSNLQEKFETVSKHTAFFRQADLNESRDSLFDKLIDDLEDDKDDK